MSKITAQDLRGEMEGFTGTTAYYQTPFLLITDGMKFVADKAGAYWLVDAIGSHWRTNGKLRTMSIIFWKLTVNSDGTAMLEAWDDIPGTMIVGQRIEFTDFPEGEWIFYQQGDVLHLPSEY